MNFVVLRKPVILILCSALTARTGAFFSIYLDLTQLRSAIAKPCTWMEALDPLRFIFSIRPVYLREEYSHLMAAVARCELGFRSPHTDLSMLPNGRRKSRPFDRSSITSTSNIDTLQTASPTVGSIHFNQPPINIQTNKNYRNDCCVFLAAESTESLPLLLWLSQYTTVSQHRRRRSHILRLCQVRE